MSNVLLIMLGLACAPAGDPAVLDCAITAEFPRMVECARAKELLPPEIEGVCLGPKEPFEPRLG